MLKYIENYLESLSRPVLLLVTLVMTALLGVVDYATGPELSFSVFYTGPIMLAAWYGGRKAGLTVALISAGVWLTADMAEGKAYSHHLIPLWNTLVRLGFFLIILKLMLSVKDKLDLEASLADTDPLTGLSNRRYFQEQLDREWLRVRRYPGPITIAYIDLDNFKYVNDTLGHDVGDMLLKLVAERFSQHVRNSDLVARLGGDEFALLLPVTDSAAARVVIEKLRQQALEAMRDRDWPVSLSVGAITFNRPMGSTREMLKTVDDLMYQVKKSDKNNVRHDVWPIAPVESQSSRG